MTAIILIDDHRLLERWLRRGDESAFAVLVERHRPMVTAVCRRILHQRPEAEDAVQEAFLAFARHAESIRGEPGAWLRACASNAALSQRRRLLRRHPQALPAEPADPGAAVGAGSETGELLDACLAMLSPEERDLIVRHFLCDQSLRSLARAQGVSTVAVHRRLGRVLDHLRRRSRRAGLSTPPPR